MIQIFVCPEIDEMWRDIKHGKIDKHKREFTEQNNATRIRIPGSGYIYVNKAVARPLNSGGTYSYIQVYKKQ